FFLNWCPFSLHITSHRTPSLSLFPYTTLFRSQRAVEAQTGYNFLTGNGSNPINSKTVQQDIKGKKVANVSFTDIESDYSDTLKRSEEHTSELQSRFDLVCRLLLEKKINIVFYI